MIDVMSCRAKTISLELENARLHEKLDPEDWDQTCELTWVDRALHWILDTWDRLE